MESRFEIGDRLVRKGSRDSAVMCIERIYYRFGMEPTYELKPIGSCGGRQMLGEEALMELYIKIDEKKE